MKKTDKDHAQPQKEKVSVEGAMTRRQVIGYLECMLAGLRDGTVRLEHQDRTIALTVPDRLELEITAKRKGQHSKLEMEISWQSPCSDDAPCGQPARTEENRPAGYDEEPADDGA